MIAALALAVIAGSAYYSAGPLKDLWKDLGAGGQPAVSASPELAPPPPILSRFLVFRRGAAGGSGAVVVSQYAAAAEESPDLFFFSPHRGALAREVMSQALLITARDELGLATRDLTLGDRAPGGMPDIDVEVATPYVAGPPVRVMVRGGGDRRVLWTRDLPLRVAAATDYADLVEAAEAFSRGPFVDALKAAGLAGKPNAARPGATIDQDTEDRLASLTFTTQFAALRDLHAALRSDGESPARLGALVRAYAHLGTLTEFHWNPSHKVFKARALLYAQRLAARDPQSPWGTWHRAYALALAGRHGDALDDLAEAKGRLESLGAAPGQAAARPESPAWADLIDAYCRFDTAALAAATEGPDASRAQLLRFLSAEDYYDSTRRTLDTAQAVLKADPECFRAHDALCAVGGVDNLHRATIIGPQVLAVALPRRLLRMRDLPEAVGALARRGADPTALARALIASGAVADDPGEPSWGVLGRMVQEVQFVQVWRRLAFMRDAWNVPVAEFLEEARPQVADHPYRPFLESYGLASEDARRALDETLRRINQEEVDLTERPFFRAVETFNFMQARRLEAQARHHSDEIYRDLELQARFFVNPMEPSFARRLRAISPHAPFAYATLIQQEWDSVRSDAAGWETRFAQHPQVIGRLALRYAESGRAEDAERCLRAYIRLSPDRWAYEKLAESYMARGLLDRWKETLDEFLREVEDYGLDHARIRVEIAQYFMERGRYDEAQPYAEAAAQTWAGWAMDCAGQCYEGLQDWERAELWFRRESERYPVSWMNWFLFCKRTGHGDVRSAQRLAAAFLDAAGDRLTDNQQALAVIFYDLADEPRKGVEFLRKRFPRPQHILEGLFLAQFADELGDARLRDETWGRIPPEDATVVRVAALFREAVAKGPGGGLDLKAVDAVLATADETRQADLCYFVGRFLQQRGTVEAARGYLERCASSPRAKPLFRVLARDALRGRDAVPDEGKPDEATRKVAARASALFRPADPSPAPARSGLPLTGGPERARRVGLKNGTEAPRSGTAEPARRSSSAGYGEPSTSRSLAWRSR